MCGIEEKKYDFFYIEEDVLEMFKLKDEKQFNAVHEKLKNIYLEESQSL